MNSNKKMIEDAIKDHLTVVQTLLTTKVEELSQTANAMIHAVEQNKKIFWMGNGGSAADSQHMAAELVARFTRERRAIPSIALTVDTSAITAIANDYGYEFIFSRQVEALVEKGDVVIGISTSGNSPNVVRALELAKEKGAILVGMMGSKECKMDKIVDFKLKAPSPITARIQECHAIMGHILCDLVEAHFAKE